MEKRWVHTRLTMLMGYFPSSKKGGLTNEVSINLNAKLRLKFVLKYFQNLTVDSGFQFTVDPHCRIVLQTQCWFQLRLGENPCGPESHSRITGWAN